MRHYGDFNSGDTVYVTFNTHQADGTPIALGGSPIISVYKRGNTAESTAGVTLTGGYDSRTGYNVVAIATAADASFYAADNDFGVVITAGTVDGTSVAGTEVGSFSLEARSGLLATAAGMNALADAILNRDMSAVADSTARSPLNALRFLRNKWSISGTTLTVTKENDTTSAWTATVTETPGASPVTGSDPA